MRGRLRGFALDPVQLRGWHRGAEGFHAAAGRRDRGARVLLTDLVLASGGAPTSSISPCGRKAMFARPRLSMVLSRARQMAGLA